MTVWATEAPRSSAYDGIILSDLEIGIRTHHDNLRQILPILNSPNEPEPGTLVQENERIGKNSLSLEPNWVGS